MEHYRKSPFFAVAKKIAENSDHNIGPLLYMIFAISNTYKLSWQAFRFLYMPASVLFALNFVLRFLNLIVAVFQEMY
jgi:hypothetical protein